MSYLTMAVVALFVFALLTLWVVWNVIRVLGEAILQLDVRITALERRMARR